MITGACTNRCVFCYHHSIDAKNDPRSKHLYELRFSLSYEDFCKIVDMAYDARVPHIHIVGNWRTFFYIMIDILKMIDYVIEKYGKVSFQTNFNKKLFEKKDI